MLRCIRPPATRLPLSHSFDEQVVRWPARILPRSCRQAPRIPAPRHMHPDASRPRPPCASRLRRSPCTSPRCVPIRTPPCKTRCIRRMPTSCRCRTALATQSQSHLHTPGCTSPSTSPRHTSIPTPPCIPSNTRPRPPGSRHQNAPGCLVLCARAPHDCLIPNHHSSHRHLLTLEPSISCLRLCARAHHARPIPHSHPSHRHLLIALARHALPALPASPAHTPLPRFAPGVGLTVYDNSCSCNLASSRSHKDIRTCLLVVQQNARHVAGKRTKRSLTRLHTRRPTSPPSAQPLPRARWRCQATSRT